MIQIKTGEFRLDDYNLVIHPSLSLSEFRAGDIPILETNFIESSKYTTLLFSGTIEKIDVSFAIQFEAETLLSLRFGRIETKAIMTNEGPVHNGENCRPTPAWPWSSCSYALSSHPEKNQTSPHPSHVALHDTHQTKHLSVRQ